jgi:hypothetical protein
MWQLRNSNTESLSFLGKQSFRLQAKFIHRAAKPQHFRSKGVVAPQRLPTCWAELSWRNGLIVWFGVLGEFSRYWPEKSDFLIGSDPGERGVDHRTSCLQLAIDYSFADRD